MRVKLTQSAERDLEDIEDYIGRDNPAAAIDTVLRVVDLLGNLADNPNMGRPGRVPNTRELVIADSPFIAPYRIRENVVEVLRVLHGSRKWPKRL